MLHHLIRPTLLQILQVGFPYARDDSVCAEETGQMDVPDKIGDTLRVHQVAVSAHRRHGKAVVPKQFPFLKQILKAHGREDVFRPPFRRGQFDVMEPRLGDSFSGFLEGIAMVTV